MLRLISDLCCADSDTNKVRQSLRSLRFCLLRFPLPPALLVFPILFSPPCASSDSCFLTLVDLVPLRSSAWSHLLCFSAPALVVIFYRILVCFCLDVGSKCRHHAEWRIPASIIPSQAAVATAAQAAAAKAERNKRKTVILPNTRGLQHPQPLLYHHDPTSYLSQS